MSHMMVSVQVMQVWVPFQAESQVEHHFLSSKEIVWEMITSLEMYNYLVFGNSESYCGCRNR